MKDPYGNEAGTPPAAVIQQRYDNRIMWNAGRFPWFVVESMAVGCSLVLESSPNNLYESNFIRPKPVVTKISVKKQGELGTTRRAVVSITAFSDEQLLDLQKCFFIPGMSVRVQFGWAHSMCSNAQPLRGVLPDTTATCRMNQGDPCRDGLQGMVAHFSYTLTNTNTWDCTLEIISAAEGVGGASFDNNCCNCAIKVKDEKGDEVSKNVPNLLAMFIHLASGATSLFGSFYSMVEKYKKDLGSDGHAITAEFNADERSPDGSAETGMLSMIANFIDNDVTEGYISYGALENAINANMPTGEGKNVAGRLDSSNTDTLRIPEGLMSADPRVCLVGTPAQDSILDRSDPIPWFRTSDKGGSLRNIMINCIFLGQCYRTMYDNGGNLKDFIIDVLAGINDACGSPWEFDVISGGCGDAEKEAVPTISVVSQQGGLSSGQVIPFKGLRDIKFDLKLTDAMKTAALYSNKSSNTALPCSKDNKICDQIALAVLANNIKNGARAPLDKPAPCPCEEVKDEEIVPEEPLTYEKAIEQLNDQVTDATVQALKPLLIQKYKGKIVEDSCEGQYLPFSFGFTCDGIGGFRFGQSISFDRPTGASAQKWIYQIAAVEHDVSAQDWTTTVSTVARFKP